MRGAAAVLLLSLPLLAAEGEVLDALLARGGIVRADLGVNPKEDWPGNPHDLRFALPHVADLAAAPLRLPAFGDAFRLAVERNGRNAVALLLEATVRPRLPGLEAPELPDEADLANVLAGLRRPPGGEALPVSARDRAEAERLPPRLRAPVARLLAALDAADDAVRRAWREVPEEAARAAVDDTRFLPELADGARPFPAVEGAARGLDAREMARAGLLALGGVRRAARELAGVRAPRRLRWEVATPRGRVRVSGRANDQHDAKDGPFLALVDLGGNDTYIGGLAAGRWPGQPVSVLLDLAGNDRYSGEDAAQGAGLGGVGVLWDAAGNDLYRAVSRAQGFAQLGVGVLVDEAGNDEYTVAEAGQGSAVFGSGLLLDGAGDDVYSIDHDGQGFGGPGGAGLLADLAGNDRYAATRDPLRAGRPDPKSGGKAATSNAQGVGIGRYGDRAAGRAWAGGLGLLVDLSGDDSYSGGTWCQGAGYVGGTGILADGAGNDSYEAVWYAQGSAAHAAFGLLLERAGDDRYALVGTGGAGMGFGWDFAAGMLVDLSGNDVYRAERLALGAAMQRSLGLFLDLAGDDRYEVTHPEEALGFVDEEERWRVRDPRAPAWFDASQAGLFLDLGGHDLYPEGRGADGASWGTWEPGRQTAAPRNLGAGIDADVTPVTGPPLPELPR